MHRILNALYVLLTIFFLYIPISSNAYAIGLGNPTANVNQNNVAAPKPIQNNVIASNANQNNGVAFSANQNVMAAVGYHMLHKNLTPKDPVVMAQETDVPTDCDDVKTGSLRSQGAFGEQTVCPEGFLPHAIESTETPTGGFIYRVIENAVGKVYFRLRCCRAHVTYS